jgi:6-phosphogluconolactonase
LKRFGLAFVPRWAKLSRMNLWKTGMRSFVLLWAGIMGDSVKGDVFYIGTYNQGEPDKGIFQGSLDPATGKLGPIRLATPAPSPSFLAFSPDGKHLYASQEGKPGQVGAYEVQADKTLKPLNTMPSEGGGACHVWVGGGYVFVANYGDGNIACLPVQKDGSVGKATAVVSFTGKGPTEGRQEKPHAHAMLTDTAARFAYACDLGTDNVWSFAFDPAKGSLTATEPPSGKTPPGTGPRHMAWGAGEKFLYVNNELDLSVTVFKRDADKGTLEAVQTIAQPESAAPWVEKSTSSEIQMHPNGRWLYVSNRRDDTISHFNVGADGRLSWVEKVSAEVRIPRGFSIDPSGKWFLSAGQKDNRIAVLRIDSTTGKLSASGESVGVSAPVCLLFPPR